MFQNVRSSIGQNGQSNKEQQIQQLANSAQTILSTFSNSGKGETSQTSEYLNFGKSFGLGSALDNKKRKKRQSSQIPNIFNLLEDIAHKSKELRQQRQKQQQNDHQYSPPLNRQYLSRSPQASTSIGRITDNFGKNFFQMIDELYEYANMPGHSTPAHLTPPDSLPISSTTPSLQQLFPWLPTFPTLPPPPPPPSFPTLFPTIPLPTTTIPSTPPPPSYSSASRERDPPLIPGNSIEVAKDFADANKLMRSFLKIMSKNAKKPLRPMPALNDGTELGRNRPLMDQLFESDILLTSRQAKAIVLAEAERKGGKRRKKRKVITGSAYRWPKGQPIPYSFRESDKDWQRLIQDGLRLWEEETCLRFMENRGRTFVKDRIEFIRGSGCYSSVGRTGGTQKISIGYGCDDQGIVSHEVGHALGFWHEQSRPDRDQYIRLEDRYIMGGTEGNFAKRSDLEADGMGLPYDLGYLFIRKYIKYFKSSVMHYGPNAFTIDWDKTTIITKDPKYQRSIGQRIKPSFIDVKQINRLYCHDKCIGTSVVCLNGGYADTNNCDKCKCPPGLGGSNCAVVESSEDPFCGGELTATIGIWQHLTHRGARKCNWRIKTDGNHRIRFILDSVSYSCSTTCQGFVEIKHNSDFQQIGFRVCCEEQHSIEVLSEQAEILIISDPQNTKLGAFTLRYIADTGSGSPLPKPPPPAWIPGRENRAFRGVQNKGGVIEKFILNAIPRVRDPDRPVESVASILTDYFASSLLGVSKRK
ncbi:Metalloendopeptidase [Meloidogyne graminicola]|uniref:Metalloendopeptidase n=1 Tax=Meloidogyne graminicola TaxID=189291 RepID=A0A8T0A0H6_9BILA|nr:Metalloendopeptidase [Meloidogyne graminicola]